MQFPGPVFERKAGIGLRGLRRTTGAKRQQAPAPYRRDPAPGGIRSPESLLLDCKHDLGITGPPPRFRGMRAWDYYICLDGMVSSGLAPAEPFPRPGSHGGAAVGRATVRDGRSSPPPRRLVLDGREHGRGWPRVGIAWRCLIAVLVVDWREVSDRGVAAAQIVKSLRTMVVTNRRRLTPARISFATRLLLRRVAAA